MLRWRLIGATAILVPLLTLLYVDYSYSGATPGIWLMPLGFIGCLLAAGEVLNLLAAQAHTPLKWTVLTGVAMIFVASCAPQLWPLMGSDYPPDCPLGRLGWPLAAAALAMGLAFVGEMLRYKEPGNVIVNVALAVFTIAYIGLPFSFVAHLRFFHGNEWGLAALVSMTLVVKMSDTGAYTFGKLWGKHKLAPLLSPGKTVEGAVGAIVAGCGSSWAFFAFVVPMLVPDAAPTPAWGALLYGLLVTVAGMVGDLCESLLKRDMQRKDSSSWLPGLGGVLDVLDSVLLAAPVAFLCWMAGFVGPG